MRRIKILAPLLKAEIVPAIGNRRWRTFTMHSRSILLPGIMPERLLLASKMRYFHGSGQHERLPPQAGTRRLALSGGLTDYDYREAKKLSWQTRRAGGRLRA